MHTLLVHKAQEIGDKTVDSLTVIFDREVPKGLSLRQYREFYEAESDRVVAILKAVLPGGTLDLVIGKLMLEGASLFLCPMFTEEPKGGDAGE